MDSIDFKGIPDLKNYVPKSVKEAFSIQKTLSTNVSLKDGFNSINRVAGIDLSILKQEKNLICGIILFKFPELTEIERVFSVSDEKFPYVPGLLAFREGPAIIETFGKLKEKPDLLILDGQGIAHPRRFGIACHVGVILGVPAMGIAKKKLYGTYDEPGITKGSSSQLVSKDDDIIGTVLRTKDNTKPVFISPGHMVTIETATQIASECARGYRIPEPTRLADKYVAELKKEII